jgi:hypothetical protein
MSPEVLSSVLLPLVIAVAQIGTPLAPAPFEPPALAGSAVVLHAHADRGAGGLSRRIEEAARTESRNGAIDAAAAVRRQEGLTAQEPDREKSGTQTRPGPPEPGGLTPFDLSGSRGQVSSGTAFNPAMSLIPDMVYYNDNVSGDGPDLIGAADGFHGGHAETGAHDHAHGGGLVPGFNLRELEVALSGAADPYFEAMATLAVGRDGLELEEVYVRTRRLPSGWQVKAGKFYSDIGYINRQHPHQWAFVNQNLANQLVLGAEGLNEIGVQATWLPDLPVYVLVGAEALQGENAAMAGYLGPEDEHPFLRQAAGPRLFTGFTKVSPDLGYDRALQIGGSIARARVHQEDHEDHFLEGSSWLIGLDAVFKYDSPRAHGEGDVVLQAEYLRRIKSLAVVGHSEARLIGEERRFTQDGFYAQAVYGIAPRWTAAVRFDVAGLANRLESGATLMADDPASRRFTANVTFDPTHFSRLRFQVDRAGISIGGVRQSFTSAHVQLQVSLGVHGAHRF